MPLSLKSYRSDVGLTNKKLWLGMSSLSATALKETTEKFG
jgi:hypothetical protein